MFSFAAVEGNCSDQGGFHSVVLQKLCYASSVRYGVVTYCSKLLSTSLRVQLQVSNERGLFV